MRLVSSKPVGQRKVYDIEVEQVHNFYANGVNVHNCATDGGVSVIKDDGTVVDITTSADFTAVEFIDQDIAIGYDLHGMRIGDIPNADVADSAFGRRYGEVVGSDALILAGDNTVAIVQAGDYIAYGSSAGDKTGLTLLHENPTTPAEGSVAYITSKYNTGWMNGDIKGAWTPDVDVGSSISSPSVVPDRSVNGNDITVYGTLTAANVGTTNKSVVALSGFSSSNYLEQPYNSDLDFGTGDFYVMGWVKQSASASGEFIFDRDTPATAQRINAYITSDGTVAFECDDNTTVRTATTTVTIDDGVWHKLAMVYDGVGGLVLYVDGGVSATASGAALLTLTNTSAVLTLGATVDHAAPLTNGSLALWRIGAGAPSAEEISRIYAEEKVLFNSGTTHVLLDDAVTALDHDKETGELLVGGASGVNIMQGLVVTDTDTDRTSVVSVSQKDGIKLIEGTA